MKMIDYLDKDRERVLASLRGASTPADAQQILEKEADRLLLQYNEDCSSVRMRDAAAGMIQALRSSVPLLDTMGEPRVWRRDGSDGNGTGTGTRGKNLSHILLGIGIVLTAAAFAVPALTAGGTAAMGALLKGLILPVAGGGCMYFAGKTSATETRIGIGSTKNAGSGSAGAPAQRIEITIDPEKLWSSLRGAIMVIDRNLEIAGEEEKYERQKELSAAVGAKGISAEEIELFSGLLEMADADSPQMAADIRYYLHKKDVDVLSWSAQNAAWFEMLPSMPGRIPASKSDSSLEDTVMTIRPALAQNGRLLKKGTAVR
jgi:hypothetical protein